MSYHQIKFTKSFGPYSPGDRTGRTDEELDEMEAKGASFVRLNTSTDSRSKSDPEVRDSLRDEARLSKAKDALDEDDYMEMRSALADLSDEPATGTKDEIRDRLEAIVNGAD